MTRDAEMQALVDAARSGDVEHAADLLAAAIDDDPAMGDDRADTEFAARVASDSIQSSVPRTVLVGDQHTAYAKFCEAAHALKAHNETGVVVMERYKQALARLSDQATKRG